MPRARRSLTEYEPLITHAPNASMGVTIASAGIPQNDMASATWVTLWGTPLVGDYHAIRIWGSDVGSNGNGRNAFYEVGWDPAGGTNYGATALTKIPFLDMGYAGLSTNSPVSYLFPVLIPGGSTLGVRCTVASATSPNARAWATLYKARDPKNAIFGTQVLSFGEQTSLSRGVDIAHGQGAEGSWTLHTSGIVTPAPFIWLASSSPQAMTTISQGVVQTYEIGFGSSTTNLRSAGERWFQSILNTAEQKRGDFRPAYCRPDPSDNIYARARSSNATTHSIMVYGVR